MSLQPSSTVAILHLGRRRGMGEARRLASWCSVLESAGYAAADLPLLTGARPRPQPQPTAVRAVLSGQAVPETLAWSLTDVRRRLSDLAPSAVICLTARTYHPRLAPAGVPVVLDFVDRLSVSYRDRARITGGGKGAGFRALAATHARFERTVRVERRTAAGRADAAALGAEWFPNVIDTAEPVDGRDADHDLLFFGNLAYPPNVSALDRLARLWPALQRRRPGITALVAGANPGAHVRELAAAGRWEVVPDFDDLRTIATRARVAVAPLTHTAGMQNKVLEAAALGLAQVVTSEAAAGLDGDFPVKVAASDELFVDLVVDLLRDPAGRCRLAHESHRHVARRYSAAAWAAWADAIVRPPR